jgi:predicted MFS family arabinose efflux permease
MKIELNKDLWAGVMLTGIGAAALFVARDYRFGSALRMGPGFFPTVLSWILMAFGIGITIFGLCRRQKTADRVSARALILIPLSLVMFGVLMKLAGFVPSLAAMVFISAAAGRQFELKEVVLLTVTLTAAAVALFVWGLELPYPLFKGL